MSLHHSRITAPSLLGDLPRLVDMLARNPVVRVARSSGVKVHTSFAAASNDVDLYCELDPWQEAAHRGVLP